MKKTFFALALLVPALAAAAVKLDVTARYADDQIEQSIELNQESKSIFITHAKGINAVVSLEKEEADFAEFLVEIKAEERELSRSLVKVAYGEKKQLICTAEGVDAELTLVASPVVSVAQ